MKAVQHGPVPLKISQAMRTSSNSQAIPIYIYATINIWCENMQTCIHLRMMAVRACFSAFKQWYPQGPTQRNLAVAPHLATIVAGGACACISDDLLCLDLGQCSHLLLLHHSELLRQLCLCLVVLRLDFKLLLEHVFLGLLLLVLQSQGSSLLLKSRFLRHGSLLEHHELGVHLLVQEEIL